MSIPEEHRKDRHGAVGAVLPSLPSSTRRRLALLLLVWAVVIAASLGWNLLEEQRSMVALARAEARALFNKDLVYRRWAAGHGGVYVPKTESTPVNPNLAHIEERDIETPSGRQLTLINPAYMTRQVLELGAEQYGVRGHITSLNPLRPENAPDPWERGALQQFAQGKDEISELSQIDGEEYLRYMRPLITESRCVKCHAAQGYREGDIHGGISVSVPIQPYRSNALSRAVPLVGGHLIIWVIGMAGIWLGGRGVLQRERARNQTELRLRESEQRYQAFLSTSSEAIWRIELDQPVRTDLPLDEQVELILQAGYIAECNDAMAHMLGLSGAQEATGLRLQDTLPGTAQNLESLRRIVRSGYRLTSYETVERRPDGQERVFLTSIAGVVQDGLLVHAWGMNRDITETRRAEEALRVGKERFDLAIQAARDGVWDWNILTNEEYFSPRWCAIIGFSDDDQSFPHTYESWASRIHPDDREQVERALRNHLEHGEPYDVEYRHRHRSGEYRWQSSRGQAVFAADGTPVRMVGCISDIHERKTAEEATREQLVELRRWHELTLEREERVQELKTEVNALLRRLGEPERYTQLDDSPVSARTEEGHDGESRP